MLKATLEAKLKAAEEALQSVLDYAQSAKFNADPNIHRNDIILRVREGQQQILEAGEQMSDSVVATAL